MDAEARAEWRAGLNRGLRAAQAQIARLLEETEDSDLQKGLETLNGDLEALLHKVTSISPSDPSEDLSSLGSTPST
jgi:hypothetical protein